MKSTLHSATWFLRIAISAVFLYHGLTKDLNSFAKHFKLPLIIAALVIFAEIIGGFGYLIGGFYEDTVFGLSITQLSSLALIPVLLGAIYLVHWKNGFNVMNGGYEYQFVLLMIAIYLFINE
jgi:putative oxidoreductase